MASRRMAGWLGLLAAVAVAGCTASPAPGPAVPGHGRAASPAARTAVSPGAASGSAPAGAGGVDDLAVSRNVRNELTAAYVDYRGISAADIAGTRPGSVYYAVDPATHTYWAQAGFAPSSTASAKVLVSFQDGASIGLFTRTGNGSWQVQLAGAPPVCTEARFFPRAVLLAWSLPTETAALGCGGSQPPRHPAPVDGGVFPRRDSPAGNSLLVINADLRTLRLSRTASSCITKDRSARPDVPSSCRPPQAQIWTI
jgi:hypothetical protein